MHEFAVSLHAKPYILHIYIERERVHVKLRALVYNILPPAAAITDYATGLGKQFSFGAEMAVNL